MSPSSCIYLHTIISQKSPFLSTSSRKVIWQLPDRLRDAVAISHFTTLGKFCIIFNGQRGNCAMFRESGQPRRFYPEPRKCPTACTCESLLPRSATYGTSSGQWISLPSSLFLSTSIKEPEERLNKVDLAAIREALDNLELKSVYWCPDYKLFRDALN